LTNEVTYFSLFKTQQLAENIQSVHVQTEELQIYFCAIYSSFVE